MQDMATWRLEPGVDSFSAVLTELEQRTGFGRQAALLQPKTGTVRGREALPLDLRATLQSWTRLAK
eukprot:UN4088